MNPDWFHWGGVAGWLVLSLFMSGMEAAVMALNRLRIRHLAREGNKQARVLLRHMDQPENFLWTIFVGNTVANFALVLLLTADLHAALGDTPWRFWTAILLLGLVLYIFGDLLAKSLFRKFPNRLALRFVPAFRLIHGLLSPLVALVERFAALLLRWTGDAALSSRLFGNRDELRALMFESGNHLGATERTLISRVLDLQNRTVGQLARPLDLADTVTLQTPISEVRRRWREAAHTRLPVWDSERRERRVVGVISLKNVLYEEPDPARVTAGDFLKPAIFLQESTRLEVALRHLQRSGQPLAIVVDPAGRERGLVSLTDILRVVFGEVNV